MKKETEFFIYLIERYAAYKNTNAREIYERWEELEIITLIYNMYERYHVERLQNAFEDIDELMTTLN